MRMSERKVAVTRVSDAIALELEQRVLEGSLKAGDRLPAERELAAEMGVSRASLREAIQKLVARGLLATRQGEGTFVTNHLDAGFVEPWEELLRKHPSVREDLLEFRHMLEAAVAKSAAQRATDADRARLRKCCDRLELAFAGDDLDEQVDADLSFHQAIAEAAHNAIFGHLSASMLRLMRENIRRNLSEMLRMPGTRERLTEQHRAVLAAIEGGAGGEAEIAATAHIDYVRDSLIETLRGDARRESALRRLHDS
jgi:GntR family transcriptional repressor for pyruvate dehydrogenase complex